MSDSATEFDAYYEWLGIHPKDQPPDHYRLLGIERFEANESVIATAADRQMRHVRSFQDGPHAELSQQLLNRLSAARVCLLKPEAKQQYDQQLRARLSAAISGLRRAQPLPDRPAVATRLESTTPAAPRKPAPPKRPSGGPVLARSTQVQTSANRQYALHREPATPVWQRPVFWGPAAGLVALLLAGVVALALSSGDSDEIAQNPPPTIGGEDSSRAVTDGTTPNDEQKPPTNAPGDSPFVEVEPAPQPPDPQPRRSVDASTPPESRPGDQDAPQETEIDPASVPDQALKPEEPLQFETVPAPGSNDTLNDLLTPLRMFAESEGGIPIEAGTAPHPPLGVGELARFSGAKGPLRVASVSRDGKYVAAGGDDKICYILDAKTLKPVRRYGPHAQPITGIAWKSDNSVGISTKRDTVVRHSIFFWNWATGKEEFRVEHTDMNSYGLKISPDERWFAVTMGTNEASLISFVRHRVTRLGSQKDNLPTHCVAFSPDSTWLVLGKTAQLARVRFLPTGEMNGWEPSFPLSGQITVNDIAFVSDGSVFLTALSDGSIAARRLVDCKLSGNIPAAHTGNVTSVTVSPNDKLAASGGEDRFVRVWDLTSAKRVLNFSGHKGAITDVAFVDDDVIASTSEDGTVRLWKRGAGKAELEPPARVQIKRRGDFHKLANGAVPGKDQQIAAVKVVREVYSADFARAKDNAARTTLANKLLEEASQPRGSPVDRYALLIESRRLAIESAAVDAALDATWAIAAWFDVDAYAEQADVINRLAVTANSVKQSTDLAAAACFAARDAAAAGRFDLAEQSAARAIGTAVRARDPGLRRLSREVQAEVATTIKQWEALQRAASVLRDSPNDASAKLMVGKFLIVARGQWNRGLKYLAEGNDTVLRGIAEADLAQPSTAEERVQLAERWKSLADARSGSERQAYLAAAAYWYHQAAGDLEGLPKIKIEQALTQVGEIDEQKRRY